MVEIDLQSTYYAAPQTLSGENIARRTHVTIQTISDTDFSPCKLPDAAMSSFKDINNADGGQGDLEVAVDAGLPAVRFPFLLYSPITMGG